MIAATIIGILAVFATVAYRNSASDARAASAKAYANVPPYCSVAVWCRIIIIYNKTFNIEL